MNCVEMAQWIELIFGVGLQCMRSGLVAQSKVTPITFSETPDLLHIFIPLCGSMGDT